MLFALRLVCVLAQPTAEATPFQIDNLTHFPPWAKKLHVACPRWVRNVSEAGHT